MTETQKPTQGGNQGRGPAGRGGNRAGGPGGNRRPGGDSRGRGPRPEQPKPEFEQRTVAVRRVTRVTSGGRRFSFSVVLAIGDKKGQIGVGVGKGLDTALAIQKAYTDAKKSMLKLRLDAETNSIAHDAKAKFNSAHVFMMPNKGRGVVAGSAMRMLFELAGVHNVTARVLSGSKNKLNIARATMKALEAFTARKA